MAKAKRRWRLKIGDGNGFLVDANAAFYSGECSDVDGKHDNYLMVILATNYEEACARYLECIARHADEMKENHPVSIELEEFGDPIGALEFAHEASGGASTEELRRYYSTII